MVVLYHIIYHGMETGLSASARCLGLVCSSISQLFSHPLLGSSRLFAIGRSRGCFRRSRSLVFFLFSFVPVSHRRSWFILGFDFLAISILGVGGLWLLGILGLLGILAIGLGVGSYVVTLKLLNVGLGFPDVLCFR